MQAYTSVFPARLRREMTKSIHASLEKRAARLHHLPLLRMDFMSGNPLLEEHTLPVFSAIKPEHVVPAITALTEGNLRALDAQLSDLDQPTWQNLVSPINERDEKLNTAWSPVSHLNLVCNSESLREAHDQSLALLSPYWTKIGQNKSLFEAYTALSKAPEFATYTPAQITAIKHALRDFKLSGIDLTPDKQQRYSEIQTRLSQLSSQFSNNVLDATQAWFYHTEDSEALVGIPPSVVAAAKNAAEKKGLAGYVLTLDGPVYLAVMTYADKRELRETVYTAYATRASDQGPHAGKWDNSALIEEILALRHELAQLLGFADYAERSLATKMAESPEQVVKFLRELAAKARPAAQLDLEQLQSWVAERFQLTALQPWDISYYSEKLRQEKYSVSQEVLRQYFTLPRVLSGLFQVAEKLFGIAIVEHSQGENAPDLWHPDARYFEITRGGEKIAAFYLDLFARDGKRGGAWMDECRVRRATDAGIQLPVAYLVCNFNGPVADKPALLTHSDVTTLFHEFGHGLHHMLTQIDVPAVSGIRGVEWDAVELPSQFLENWAWQPEVLRELSAHVDSGEALSDEQIEKMLAAKNFQAGMFLVRQIEFALFDILIHQGRDNSDVQTVLNAVRDDVAVIKPPAFHRFQHSFTHVFAGGYAAGYYSYLWAEVLSADVFGAFEEKGIFDPETGRRFYERLLSQGGSANAAELFRHFRGREPSVDALLRHKGIA